MKLHCIYNALILSALTTTGSSLPSLSSPYMVQRDIPTFQGVLENINSSINRLHAATTKFVFKKPPLITAFQNLNQVLEPSTSIISATNDLTLTDALGLTTPL